MKIYPLNSPSIPSKRVLGDIITQKLTTIFLLPGYPELHEGWRRVHDHQQREEPAGHPPQGHDGVLLPGGDAQVPVPAVRGHPRDRPGPMGVQHRGTPAPPLQPLDTSQTCDIPGLPSQRCTVHRTLHASGRNIVEGYELQLGCTWNKATSFIADKAKEK